MPQMRKTKHLELIQDRCWAILPAKLSEIQAFIDAHYRGVKVEDVVLGFKNGNRADDTYDLVDGVAIIPVYGTLAKRMNLMMEISGGTSTDLLRRDFQAAIDDPNVTAIVLDLDTPGGAIEGTAELADLIYLSRGIKPIVAAIDELAASAGTWIATAADKVIIPTTGVTGSIGVALTHYDFSEQDKSAGIKKTTITAGKYKRIASEDQPLTAEGKDYLQGQLDHFYSVFVDAVARNRGTTAEVVLEKMADGKIFIGQQAIDAGLVDQIGTLETAINIARQLAETESKMDLKELKEKHPDLYSAALEAGKTEASAMAKTTAEAEAQQKVTTERERIAGIMALEGDSAVKSKAIADGKTIIEAKELLFDATSEAGKKGLEQMKTKEETVVAAAAVETGSQKRDLVKLAKERVQIAKAKGLKLSIQDAFLAIEQEDPELVKAYRAGLGVKEFQAQDTK